MMTPEELQDKIQDLGNVVEGLQVTIDNGSLSEEQHQLFSGMLVDYKRRQNILQGISTDIGAYATRIEQLDRDIEGYRPSMESSLQHCHEMKEFYANSINSLLTKAKEI